MIHNIDVNYEREIELSDDDFFILEAQLNVSFAYHRSGGGWHEPRYGAYAEFVACEMCMGGKWVPAPAYMAEWAEGWLEGYGQAEAIEKAMDDLSPDPNRYHDERYDDRCNGAAFYFRDAA